MDRIDNGDFQASISANVLSDRAHKLITIEAAALSGRPLKRMSRWLKRHPAEVQGLARYRQAIDEISLLGNTILPVWGPEVSLAADVSRQTGLLSSDALIVVLLQKHGITPLASHDTDFDRVPGITRYAPV